MNVRFFCLLLASLLPATTQAAGKIDFGPVYINMKVLQNGKTQMELDMGGFRGDGTIQLFPGQGLLRGLVAKPSITYAQGDGHFVGAGIGLGHYTPITKAFAITPVIGLTYSRLSTRVDYSQYGLGKLSQVTTASAPYLALDACYTFNPTWMLSGSIQYGWAAGRTDIQTLGFSKGQSTGFAYSLMLDYYLDSSWSVNLGWAYNHMVTQELHGNKGSGVRLGIGYSY